MEVQIQELLDAQWDALEARDKNVKRIRKRLSESLDALASERTKELHLIQKQVDTNKSITLKKQTIETELFNLKSRLHAEQNSSVALKSKELKAKIEELDKAIAKLVAEKTNLEAELQESNSIVASRTCLLVDAIAHIEKGLSSSNQKSVERLQQESRTQEQKLKSLSADVEAATAGKLLWDEVRNELTKLDGEIKGFKKSQIPQISFVLSQRSEFIEQCLEKASQNGWSPLVVAIGHELQILHDTSAALYDVEISRD